MSSATNLEWTVWHWLISKGHLYSMRPWFRCSELGSGNLRLLVNGNWNDLSGWTCNVDLGLAWASASRDYVERYLFVYGDR